MCMVFEGVSGRRDCWTHEKFAQCRSLNPALLFFDSRLGAYRALFRSAGIHISRSFEGCRGALARLLDRPLSKTSVSHTARNRARLSFGLGAGFFPGHGGGAQPLCGILLLSVYRDVPIAPQSGPRTVNRRLVWPRA